MRLVNFNLIDEVWFSAEVDDHEIYWPHEGEGEFNRDAVVYGGQGGGAACVRPRIERIWRYEYRDGLKRVRGIACVARTNTRARSLIHQELRNYSKAVE